MYKLKAEVEKMAEIKAVEIYEKISKIRIDINNCEEFSDYKKRILRGNVRSMLETIDRPDSFYGARERVGYMAMFAITIILAISAFLTQWINSLRIIGVWIILMLLSALYMPSLDDITEGIIKSGNSMLYKIFIKQKK